MKRFFRDYFSFNQVEIKGIRALMIVLVCLIVTYFLVPVFSGSDPDFDTTVYQAQVDSFMAHAKMDTVSDEYIRSNKNYSYSKYDRPEKDEKGNFIMKPFDPNGLPIEIWVQMGLSEKQAGVIKNYESKGGKFKTKEDVKKQFVISDDFYKKIEPFIVFENLIEEQITTNTVSNVDINHATKEDFMQMNGVKDYLAEGIIKYRERLGGFTSVEQLKEVKYLSERIYNDMLPYCIIMSFSRKQIKINLAEWKEMAPHPYIGGDLATAIINYRKKNGIFKNADDFKKAGLVDDVNYTKLVPYLSFTH